MDPVTALNRVGGVADWRTLKDLGVKQYRLESAVIARTVLRPARDTYALPDAHPALLAAVRLNGLAWHTSAAQLLGLELLRPPEEIHVISVRGQAPPGVRIHRCRVKPGDRHLILPITNLQRTLIDCGRFLPTAESVTIYDSAIRLDMADKPGLETLVADLKGPGGAAARQAVAHVHPCGSVLESPLRLLLLLVGAQVECQAKIDGVGFLDFLLDGWLAIEADGFAFHSGRWEYRNDRRRANALAAKGIILLRFTWEDIVLQPLAVLDRIRSVLALGRPYRGASVAS